MDYTRTVRLTLKVSPYRVCSFLMNTNVYDADMYLGNSFLDARLTSSDFATASAQHTSQSLVSDPTCEPYTQPDINLSDLRTESTIENIKKQLVRSCSEAVETKKQSLSEQSPMKFGRLIGSAHFVSADASSGSEGTTSSTFVSENAPIPEGVQVESYAVRKKFWEQVSSGSTTTTCRSTRETKSERSSMVLGDDSFDGSLPKPRETKSERSSAIISEDVYEVGRYTVTKVSTSETVNDTTREISTSEMTATDVEERKQLTETVEEIDNASKLLKTKSQQIQSSLTKEEYEKTQKLTLRQLGAKDADVQEQVISQRKTEATRSGRFGLEEHHYSSGDESISLKAEDIESRCAFSLDGQEIAKEQFQKSSKAVFKDGKQVFVEESHYQESHPRREDLEEVIETPTCPVQVDVDPTTTELTRATSQDDFDQASQQEMGFINTAFIGVDHIDVGLEVSESLVARAVSPFEVPRSDAYVIGTYGPDFDGEDQSSAQYSVEEADDYDADDGTSINDADVKEEHVEIQAAESNAQSTDGYGEDSLDSEDLLTYGSEGDDQERGLETKTFPAGFGSDSREVELTREEAIQIAENIIEEIKHEAPRLAEMRPASFESSAVAAALAGSSEESESRISDCIRQITSEAEYDERQVEFIENVALKKIQELKETLSVHDVPLVEDTVQSLDEDMICETLAEVKQSLTAVQEELQEQRREDGHPFEEPSPSEFQVRLGTLAYISDSTQSSCVTDELHKYSSSHDVFSPADKESSVSSSLSKVDDSPVKSLSADGKTSLEELLSTKRDSRDTSFSAGTADGRLENSVLSRPASSDVENMMSATTAGSSEYETALTSQVSSRSATSNEFYSAVSSVSSRESIRSLDSECSRGNADMLSETSETLIASTAEHELERDLTPTDAAFDLNMMDASFKLADTADQSHQDDTEAETSLPSSWVSPTSEQVDEEEHSLEEESDSTSLVTRMKRSIEMTFHPEPKLLRESPSTSEDSPTQQATEKDDVAEDAVYKSTSTLSELTMSTVIDTGVQSVQHDESRSVDEHDVVISDLQSSFQTIPSCHRPYPFVPDITVENASPTTGRSFSYSDPADPKDGVEENENVYDDEMATEMANVPVMEEELYDQENDQEIYEMEEPLEEEIIQSPQGLVARRIDPDVVAYTYEMSFERDDDDIEDGLDVNIDQDLEKQKRWMEMQFEEAEGVAQEVFASCVPRTHPLADIEEVKEDEESINGSDRLVERLNKSPSSTPEFDVLSGRRFFTRSGDVDDISIDSLQEFERLENQVEHLRGHSNGSGSQESLSGRRSGGGISRSSQGDNISVNSLTEFERLERDLAEAAKIEERAKLQEAMLSEIDEGHESQVSESDSCETLSQAGRVDQDDTDSDDYEQRMFEIDEIIRQAQNNIEQFDATLPEEIMDEYPAVVMHSAQSPDVTRSSLIDKTESADSADSIEVDILPTGIRPIPAYRTSRTEVSRCSTDDAGSYYADSLEYRPEYSRDSLDRMRGVMDPVRSAGPSSMDSLESTTPRNAVVYSASSGCDSLDLVTGNRHNLTTSTDSIEDDSSSRRMLGPETDSLQVMAGVGSSSSSGQEDLPRDAAVITRLLHGPVGSGHSLDSLEVAQMNSAATSAFSDSFMSASVTSASSAAMIGSTDTLTEHELFGSATATGATTAHRIQETKEIISEDGSTYLQTTRTVEMQPEIRMVSFRGADIDDQMKEYVARFAPGEDVHEYESTDARGNVRVTRVVQRRSVVETTELPKFSGSQQMLEEFMAKKADHCDQLEEESYEVDDGFGNIERVVRKRIVTLENVDIAQPFQTHPDSTTISQTTIQIEEKSGTRSSEGKTSSGAGRPLRLVAKSLLLIHRQHFSCLVIS